MADWNEQIRHRIRTCGLSLYAVCKRAKLGYGPMQRFMAGRCGVTVETLEKLGPVIGAKLQVRTEKVR